MKEISFTTKMTVKSMFFFLLQHSYRGASLFINLFITVGSLALFFKELGSGDTVKILALLVMALLFSVVFPLQLFLRALRQVKNNPVFKEPIQYTLTEEGITLSQGEEKQSFQWGDIFKVRAMRSLTAVYTSRVYACIWPAEDLKEQKKEIQEMLCKHLSNNVMKRKEEA